MVTSAEPPLDTDALARRIQEVEHEIALLCQQRTRVRESADRDAIEELEARVREAEQKLKAQRTVQRKSAAPARSAFQSMRLSLYFVGGLLTTMGLFVGGMAWQMGTEPMLIAIGAAPGVIGVLMLTKTFLAKTEADLEPGDFGA